MKWIMQNQKELAGVGFAGDNQSVEGALNKYEYPLFIFWEKKIGIN